MKHGLPSDLTMLVGGREAKQMPNNKKAGNCNLVKDKRKPVKRADSTRASSANPRMPKKRNSCYPTKVNRPGGKCFGLDGSG